MRKDFLTFGAPLIEQDEIDEIAASLKSGWLSTGFKVQKFEQMFKEYKGSKFAMALNSCTAALHLQPYYQKAFGYKKGDFPNAEFISKRTVSLPLSAKLSQQDAQDVAVAVREIINNHKR